MTAAPSQTPILSGYTVGVGLFFLVISIKFSQYLCSL